MEEQTSTTNPIIPDEAVPTPHRRNPWKIIGLVIIGLLLVSGIAFAAYQAGQRQTPIDTTSQSPSPTTTYVVLSSPQPTITQVTSPQISFARVGDKTYLRYKGKIYDDTVTNDVTAHETTLTNADTYTWQKLIDTPSTIKGFDEIFSFRTIPNTKNFIFVTRYDTPVGADRVNENLIAYYYDDSKPTNKVTTLLSYAPADKANNASYQYPIVHQISSDGRYVSFSMFGCWNCDGHKPQTVVYDLQTGTKKNIGKVNDFTWKDNGAYTYKEYIVKECPQPQPGECTEDPTTLPLKTGSI